MLKRFLDYLRYERNVSERTLTTYRVGLEKFRAFWCSLDSELTWETIPRDVIRSWVVQMMDDGLKPTSVATHLSAVRTMYRYMLKMGYVQTDPARGLQPPKRERALPGYVPERDMDRLFEMVQFTPDYQGQRDRLIMLMLYSTGLRVSELISLNVEDVDLVQCQLKVTGKRNKQRIIPFGPELKDSIEGYLPIRKEFREQHKGTGLSDADALFLNKKGSGRISYLGVRAVTVSNLSLVTDQKKKSPHVLRHSFATAMLNHDADLMSIKELLGHESVGTTEIYTHMAFEDLKKAYKKAHPRD